MSRADAGSVDVFLEEVNVSELVRRSVETGIGHMDGRRHDAPEVVVDPGVERWRVGVDKRRFERVLVNLMENADHYGGGVTTIAVRPGPEPGHQAATGAASRLVDVTVDDAGPGIDPAERTKVFERFYRGSASGRRGTGTGTGLGLALVAEHMHVMRGDVRVESSPDGGARFVLSLPVLSNGDGDDDDEGVLDGAADALTDETGVDA
jgi:signal transduction histidine kinase